MADLSQKNSAMSVFIVGSSDAEGTESTPVRSTPNQDIGAVDTVNTEAVSGTVALTSAASGVEVKVGASRQVNRKYIWMQGLDSNIKWGFSPTTCVLDIFKNQILCFPLGNVPVYARTSSGTGTIAVGEGA